MEKLNTTIGTLKIDTHKGYDCMVKGRVVQHYATYAAAQVWHMFHPTGMVKYYLAKQ